MFWPTWSSSIVFLQQQKLSNKHWRDSVLQHGPSLSMDTENDILMKESINMMIDMIVLCATLALSLFFWILSLTMSTFYGELSAWECFHFKGFLFLKTAFKQEVNPLNHVPLHVPWIPFTLTLIFFFFSWSGLKAEQTSVPFFTVMHGQRERGNEDTRRMLKDKLDSCQEETQFLVCVHILGE